ncbi:MAG: hypothetical protein ACE5K4_02280 [Candidatus Hydrothermarchaeota archaeon]
MEIKHFEEIMDEIVRKYNKKPEGWGVLVGKDERGYSNIFISSLEESWHIKTETINPYKSVGFGARTDRDYIKKITEKFPSYGFRPISKRLMIELSKEIEKKGFLSQQTVEMIADIKPVPQDKLKGPMVAQGPVIYSNLRLISKKQKKLDLMLTEELEKLLHKEYPSVIESYI